MATVAKDFTTRNGVKAGGTVEGTTLKSTVSTGTAPLTVASSTVVPNLNASFLEGNAASAFATTAGKLSQFAATTSLELKGVISDETGSGALVFGTSPTITTSLVTDSETFALVNTTATTINFGGAATTLNIGNASGTVTIAGNLTVNGTTTTINSTTVAVDDKTIELGTVDVPTDVTADGGGIVLKGATDKSITWVNSTDSWTFNQNIDLGSGFVLKINGTEVLSATQYTGNAATATSATSAGKSTNLVGGNGTTLLGSVPYQSGTDTTTMLAPNTTTTKKFLRQTGDGANGAAPAWDTVTKSDVGLSNVENTALSTWAGSSNITTIGQLGSLSLNHSIVRSALTTVNQNSTPTSFDVFSPGAYTSAEYVIQMTQGTKRTTTHLLVMWDGTDIQVSEYGYVDATAGAANATLSATYSSNQILVQASSPDAATTNVVLKFHVTYITA